MASIHRRGDGWEVRWSELEVVVTEYGEQRTWRSRRRRCPTRDAARELQRDVEAAKSLGRHWSDGREAAVATIRAAVLGYVRAAVEAKLPPATQRWRSSIMGAWLDYLGARTADGPGAHRPVTELSLTLLEDYARTLPSDGPAEGTRYRKVLEVEHWWSWAADRPEAYPGVPRPRQLTGAAGDRLQRPAEPVAVAVASFELVDQVLAELGLEWHRQAAIVQRYTGLRVSQVLGLQAEDYDLERRILWVRAKRRGAKRSRTRVVPLSPHLVAELRSWAPATGLLFPSPRHGGVRRADALRDAMRRAWSAAKVDPRIWDVIEEGAGRRGHGRPTHAIRACLQAELLRAGIAQPLVNYLVGQVGGHGHTRAAYVPEEAPEQSPYWPHLVDAVAKIPSHRKVVPLPSRA